MVRPVAPEIRVGLMKLGCNSVASHPNHMNLKAKTAVTITVSEKFPVETKVFVYPRIGIA